MGLRLRIGDSDSAKYWRTGIDAFRYNIFSLINRFKTDLPRYYAEKVNQEVQNQEVKNQEVENQEVENQGVENQGGHSKVYLQFLGC